MADYLLYLSEKAVAIVEAKLEGSTLTGVKVRSGKYSAGLPDMLPALARPLPFLYESTDVETQFTNRMDPEPRGRRWNGSGVQRFCDIREHRLRSVYEPSPDYLTTRNLRQKLGLAPSRCGGPLDRAGTGHHEPGRVAGRRASKGAGADGHRQWQDLPWPAT